MPPSRRTSNDDKPYLTGLSGGNSIVIASFVLPVPLLLCVVVLVVVVVPVDEVNFNGDATEAIVDVSSLSDIVFSNWLFRGCETIAAVLSTSPVEFISSIANALCSSTMLLPV